MAQNIHERMEDRIALSRAYAEDGAFHSAARVLSEFAAELIAHGDFCNELLSPDQAPAPVAEGGHNAEA